MAPRYAGRSFDFQVSPLHVTDAVIHKNRISVDWIEYGKDGHLEATSQDGVVYCGTYGYPQLNPDYHLELRLYRAANGELVLFGEWKRTDEAVGGHWVIQLTPSTKTQAGDLG